MGGSKKIRAAEADSLMEHLEEMCRLDAQEQERTAAQMEEKNRRLEELQRFLDAADSVNELFRRFEQAGREVEKLQRQAEDMKQLKSRLKALEDSGEAAHREEQVKEQQEICRKITQQRQMQEQAVRDGRMLLAACEKSGEELKRKLQESMGSLPRELERQMAKLVSLIQKREELREEKQRRDQKLSGLNRITKKRIMLFWRNRPACWPEIFRRDSPAPSADLCITPPG